MAWNQGRAFILVAIASWAVEVAAEEAPRLRIERLAWAGIKLELGEATLLIDAVDNPDVLGALTRVPVAVTTPRRYAVATHLHNDHYDRALLKGVLGDRGRMVCPAGLAAEVVSDGLRVRSVGMGEAVTVGPFTLIPVPAVDGVGDEQVSWVVFAAGTRLLHGGDTLWHGSWDRIGAQYGPFDVAFLPINAAILGGERPPHAQPISMSPEQAVAAARLLRARILVPIHYGRSEADYVETAEPIARLTRTATSAAQAVRVLAPGEILELRQ